MAHCRIACQGPAGGRAEDRRDSYELRLVAVRLVIDVEVHDAARLTEYARRRYVAAFRDPGWSPASIGDAVMEALVISAPGPAPAEIGIEILEAVVREV